MHVLSLCFHHWFSFPVVDGFSLLLTILNFYLKIIVMLYISARLSMHACSAYEPRLHLVCTAVIIIWQAQNGDPIRAYRSSKTPYK